MVAHTEGHPLHMPRAFLLVIAAQFVSAVADNALLIVAIARLVETAAQGWLIPLLKFCFTLCYVLLAPLVGALADRWPKARVMMVANALKSAAVLMLLAGLDPVAALAVAGLGASIYAPAKYGLATEMLPASQLVRANGFIEASIVSAVILGTVLGGLLISPQLQQLVAMRFTPPFSETATTLGAGMLILVGLYSLAALINLGISDSGARYARHAWLPLAMLRTFWRENLTLWRDPLGGVSMAVTTLLWAVGATLQIIVLRWGQENLGLGLHHAAYLQGVTACGVVAGAVLASRSIRLSGATRLLPLGVLLGLILPTMSWVHSTWLAAWLMALVGAVAGFFVVPMNALLQYRGHRLFSAGRSIAVQGFNENSGILLMLALYAAATAFEVPLRPLLVGMGVLVATVMCLIIAQHRRKRFTQTSPG